MLTVGAHNAHDQAAAVRAGMSCCDLYLGNEAPRVEVSGWTTVKGGKGVIVAWRDGLFSSASHVTWHRAHRGSKLIPTPERGSLVVDGPLAGIGNARVICGHRQNGTGWPGNRKRHMWRARRRNWRKHDAMDRALIVEAHDRGAHALLGADVNRTDMEPPHPDAIPLRTGGITQLWFIPAPGATVDVGKGGSVPDLARGSSHRLQWRDLTLTP